MNEAITKASLLRELRAARAEWDALIAEVGVVRMSETGATGDWSVKDVMAHLTSYSRWFVHASEAHFRDEMPPLDGTAGMSFEQRNQFWNMQARDRPLADVQAESQQGLAICSKWRRRTPRNFSLSRSSSKACPARY